MMTRAARGRRAATARARVRAAVAAALALAAGAMLPAGSVRAAIPDPTTAPAPRFGVSASAQVDPAAGARIGDALVYRVVVKSETPVKVRFISPSAGGAFHWGTLKAWQQSLGPRQPKPVGAGAWVDTHASGPAVAEVPLQIFALGSQSVPGLTIDVDDGRGPRRYRAPVGTVLIVPAIAANDSSAQLRAVRAPLEAPWWERVPWLRVALWGGLAGLVIGLVVWLILKRRRRAPLPAIAPAARPADPALVALRELAALRRRQLPARGEFAEHAFHLTRIVRRFVESAAARVRPGDTTPEFVEHLSGATLEPDEIVRLEGLLRYWDRVKFARAGTTVEEAAAAEQSVEEFVRQASPGAGGKAA
jgi:hypothetical protein